MKKAVFSILVGVLLLGVVAYFQRARLAVTFHFSFFTSQEAR